MGSIPTYSSKRTVIPMRQHAWKEIDGSDALGPSINFQWWECTQCRAKVRTAKDNLAIFYHADGRPPPVKVTAEAMVEADVDADCDRQLVVEVHRF